MKKLLHMTMVGLTIIYITLFYSCIPKNAFAYVEGMPSPASCKDAYSWNMLWTYCELVPENLSSPEDNYLKYATEFYSGAGQTIFGAWDVYMPYSGLWKMRAYMCPSEGPRSGDMSCTIAKSVGYADSNSTVYMTSSTTILNNNGDFRGASGKIPAKTSICYTFFDPNEPSVQWKSKPSYTCQDAQELPSTPADCYINGDADLEVDLGTIERNTIPVNPDINSSLAKTKSVPVLCVRDAGTNIKTTFKYSPLSFNGNDLIPTGLNGIGVAIYYNGKLAQANQSFPVETYATGYSYVELKFVPVRNEKIALKDIGTGTFSSDAVMVLEEQ